MIIYRLEQRTWNDGAMGDFDLPRTLGHYATEALAERDRDAHSAKLRAMFVSADNHTTASDYVITPIHVVTE